MNSSFAQRIGLCKRYLIVFLKKGGEDPVFSRCPQNKVKNRQWIGYKLAQWRKKGLVEAIYGSTAGSYGALIGIRLTKLGKTLLGKPIGPNHQNNPLAPADILEIVRQLKRAHPEWKVTFEIRLKEQPVLSTSMRNN